MRIVHRILLLAPVLFVAGAVVALATALRSNGEDAPSQTSSSPAYDTSTTDVQIERLQVKLQRDPADVETLAQLGEALLQKSRETGDPAFYSKAEETLQRAIDLDPQDASALRGLATVANGRHDFATGRELAQRSLDLDPDNSRTYGVLGDSLIELGRYEEATEAFQRMIDLKPDLSAYARASYVRELHGDVEGAIEAMQRAVDSGGAKGEGVAWAHLQLGNLYFNSGDLDEAEAEYNASLAALPNYVHGQAALAKVLVARGDTAGAIAAYRDVVDRYPVLEYVIALGDLYTKVGDTSNAQQQYELVGVIDQLMKSNGVNGDLELALYYADHGTKLDEAVEQARTEYARRPSTQAADILSWTLYKTGQYEEARRYSDEALRLGNKDALYAFHAGMIREKLGDSRGATELLTRAVDTNAHFSLVYADVARDTLDQLALVSGR